MVVCAKCFVANHLLLLLLPVASAGALLYSLYSHQSNSSYTATSRSSSMTKAGDARHWQAKMLQHQQLLMQQHQHQQQQQMGGAAAAGGDNSSQLSRQSSCIPAVHGCSSSMSRIQEAAMSLYQQQQQQQQQTQQHKVYRQLTISAAADIEAPAAQDQQQQQQLQHQRQRQQAPSPLQALRSISSPAAAAAAAVGAVPPLLLPAVTLMFVSVDGSKLLRKHHVRDVHCQLSLLFMEALRHIPGSYMCRMQVGFLCGCVSCFGRCTARRLVVSEREGRLRHIPGSYMCRMQVRSGFRVRV
jgi:Flp pilus assembly protein TadB